MEKSLLFLITSVYRIIVIINRIICFIINGLSHSLHSAWLFFWNILYSHRKYTDKFVPSLLQEESQNQLKQILFFFAKLFDETYKWTEE
jgi:hypothetical protein